MAQMYWRVADPRRPAGERLLSLHGQVAPLDHPSPLSAEHRQRRAGEEGRGGVSVDGDNLQVATSPRHRRGEVAASCTRRPRLDQRPPRGPTPPSAPRVPVGCRTLPRGDAPLGTASAAAAPASRSPPVEDRFAARAPMARAARWPGSSHAVLPNRASQPAQLSSSRRRQAAARRPIAERRSWRPSSEDSSAGAMPRGCTMVMHSIMPPGATPQGSRRADVERDTFHERRAQRPDDRQRHRMWLRRLRALLAGQGGSIYRWRRRNRWYTRSIGVWYSSTRDDPIALSPPRQAPAPHRSGTRHGPPYPRVGRRLPGPKRIRHRSHP